MVKPERIKEVLQQNGLIEDDLLAFGVSKHARKVIGISLPIAIYNRTGNASIAFTLADGKLVITPVSKKSVLTDLVLRISKEDTNEIRFDTKGAILTIISKDGSTSEYIIKKPYDAIEAIINRLNI
jgi:hypothetical protein